MKKNTIVSCHRIRSRLAPEQEAYIKCAGRESQRKHKYLKSRQINDKDVHVEGCEEDIRRTEGHSIYRRGQRR